MPKPRHRTKHTLAEVEAVLAYLSDDLVENPPDWTVFDFQNARGVARYYVQAEINRRTASAKNKGRSKVLCVCGDALSEHLEGKCPHCPCDLGSGQGGG